MAGNPRPRRHHDQRRREARAIALARQTSFRDCQALAQRSHGRAFRSSDSGSLDRRRRLRNVAARRNSRAATTVGLRRQRFRRHLARRNSWAGASASARLWHVSARSQKICSRRQSADARRRHPEILCAAGATHGANRSRRTEVGHVGRCRRLRSRDHPRPRHIRQPQSVFRRDGIRTGQRRSRDRRRAK